MKFVAETWAKIQRMAAQGDFPQIKSTRDFRSRQDSYVRVRPRLESPAGAEDQFGADSFPIALKTSSFRRLNPSPKRHVSPLKYQPVSTNGLGKANNSAARYHNSEDNIAYSVPNPPTKTPKLRDNNAVISETSRVGATQADPDIQLDEVVP